MILFLNNPELAFSPKTPLEIIEAVSVNDTILSSLTVDPISNHLYVSGVPDYSYNAAPVSCLKYNTNSSNMPCSVIYVLTGGHDQINNIIRLRPGQIIHDIAISPQSGKVIYYWI